MVREIIKGGKEYVAMAMTRRCDGDFELDSAEYRVLNSKKEAIAGFGGSAQIDGKTVYALIDTSAQEYVVGREYYCDFFVAVVGLPKLIPGRVPFKVIR